MIFDLKNIPTFGIAGNFTGHLEQAGEDKNFINVVTKEKNAPKLIFPTYIPHADKGIPSFLNVYPFSDEKIIYPEYESKLQCEAECGIIFSVDWENNLVKSIKPLYFASSNDCSIRRDKANKISEKKNWGECTKGFSSNLIEIDSFSKEGILDNYNIASFLIRNNEIFDYGEDSFVSSYSYFHQTLTDWIIEKFNTQDNTDPSEDIKSYLQKNNYPTKIMISIGATRYTEFGEKNFVQKNDEIIIAIYPNKEYSHDEIKQLSLEKNFSDKSISFLAQKII